MTRTQTYGLTHLTIAVRDLEKTQKFYQHIFGMQVMYHEDKMIQLTTPGCHDILVFEEREDGHTGQSAGISHFGFRLREPSDIEDFYRKIKAAGGIILDKGEFVKGSPYIFFKDPDGYTVEVWYELISLSEKQ